MRKLTSSIRNFLWSGSSKTSKLVTVAWSKCCTPKEDGGLGLRDPSILNEALLKKLAWSLMTSDSFVYRFLRDRFFSNGFEQRRFWKSSVWCGLRSHIKPLVAESIWAVGRHSKVRFWKNNWLGTPLVDMISYNDNMEPRMETVVGDVSSGYEWSLPNSFISNFPQIVDEIKDTVIGDADKLIWRHSVSGEVSYEESYKSLAGPFPKE